MRSIGWWYSKANAIASSLGATPTVARVAMALAPTTIETACGDAWAGEHNWGATTRGSLTAAESAALRAAGIVPVLMPTAERLAREAAAAKILGPRTDRAIHTDSRPARHPSVAGEQTPRALFHAFAMARAVERQNQDRDLDFAAANVVYFTWFAAFPTDALGAAYYMTFFRTTEEKAALAGSNPEALARAMYHAHYYTGVSPDAETDVQTYTRAITPVYHEALGALARWTPGAVAPIETVEPAQGWSWRQVQVALNDALAPFALALKIDGIAGPLTRAALRAYQASAGLPTTGLADEATIQALRGPTANA